MKKICKAFLILATAATLTVGAVACSETISAYDIAVKNGFVGTEEEWLRSLHGANGEDGEDLDANALYQAALASGAFEGTFLEFCATLNIDVPTFNDTVQIAENALSVVSVFCGFDRTVTISNGMFNRPIATTEYFSSAGSGVIVDLNKEGGNAYILTNYHVVYEKESNQEQGISDTIFIYPYGALQRFDPQKGDVNGGGIEATFVGGAMDYDIAVLKVEGSQALQNSVATEAKLGDSDAVVAGEETFAIGNAGGLGISVTNGVLSVPSEYINMYALDNRDLDENGEVDAVSFRVMRTSAAINGGNSGGGLFNNRGELIGIVNAKNGQSSTDNMGYALPISQVKAVCQNAMDNGGVVKQAMLGVLVSPKSSSAVLDEDGNLFVEEKFCVAQAATKATQASYGKLNAGDIFLAGKVERGGEVVAEVKKFIRRYQLTELLLQVRRGDTVRLTVLDSDGNEKTVAIAFTDAENHFVLYP